MKRNLVTIKKKVKVKIMKAIMLAAGKSTRTLPLTITRPKPLLKVANKEILLHNLEALNGLISKLYLVVGYKKEMVVEFISKYKEKFDFEIIFVEQQEQLGTGNAVMEVFEKHPELGGKILIMSGDDIFSRKDIEECCKFENCILVKEVQDIENFGAVVEEDGFLKEIIEKPQGKKAEITKLANTALYVVSDRIRDYVKELKVSSRSEYEFTDAITDYSKQFRMRVVKVKDYWIPITYPWSLLDANKFLLERMESKVEGILEENVHVSGVVIVGEGTVIKSGVYIEGPVMIGKNCKIGPNCYLRPGTTIGNNCHIGQAVEIKNSIFFDNSNCAHLSYIGDSVIGFNVNLGAGTITANLRHDNAKVKSMVKGELISTGRRKFGTVIGDNVHTGIHTSIYPGRKIWPGRTTLPGEVVRKDIE